MSKDQRQDPPQGLSTIRGCPACRHSVRAGEWTCRHCGEQLNIGVEIGFVAGGREVKRSEHKIPMPDQDPGDEENG